MRIDLTQVIDVSRDGLAAESGKVETLPDSFPLLDRVRRVLIPEAVIRGRVRELARQISRDFFGWKKLQLIPLLKGAFMFAADLGREIFLQGGPDLRIDFYVAQTYGSEIKQEGEGKRKVEILRRPMLDPEFPVLLVDDIADTLQTIVEIKNDVIFSAGISPEQVKTCFLVEKRLDHPTPEIQALKQKFRPDYIGFTVPDVWIAGYGIDAGEDFRQLDRIVWVNESFYLKK